MALVRHRLSINCDRSFRSVGNVSALSGSRGFTLSVKIYGVGHSSRKYQYHGPDNAPTLLHTTRSADYVLSRGPARCCVTAPGAVNQKQQQLTHMMR